MGRSGFTVSTGGPVNLSPGVTRTVLGYRQNGAYASGIKPTFLSIGFDGVNPNNAPVLIEIAGITFSVNPPGTNSTALTIKRAYGRAGGSPANPNPGLLFQIAKAWTVEPQAYGTTLYETLLTSNRGTLLFRMRDLDQNADQGLGEGQAVKCTASAAVNVRASLTFEEI